MNCPLCSASETHPVLTQPGAVLANSSATRDLALNLCPACGLVFQAGAYEPGYDQLMEQVYEDYLKSEFFPFPRRSAENLASLEMILEALGDKQSPRVLEIGSNRGDFLYLLGERLPQANLLGVEPSAQEDLAVPTVRGFFSDKLFSSRFDLVIIQHVLEHIKNPAAFMAQVISVLAPEGLLFIEVPDLGNSLAHGVEDFCLEHVNYFSPASLAACAPGLGLVALDQGSFLRTIWHQGPSQVALPAPPPGLSSQFQAYDQQRARLIQEIQTHAANGGRVVFFGAAYYFRMLYRTLKPGLPRGSHLFFMDDNIDGETEPAFGLPRIQSLGKDCLVVLASNNFRVQRAMLDRLSGAQLAGVVRPWRDLVPGAAQQAAMG